MAHRPPHEASGAEPGDAAPAGAARSGTPAALEAPDYLPISFLNALLYCPRRFYYEYAQGEMLVNEHVLQGRVYHRVADAGAARLVDGTLSLRRTYVYSDRLRISGIIDVVELPPGGDEADPSSLSPLLRDEQAAAGGDPAAEAASPSAGPAAIYPVEYKKGSAHGGRANDHVQLCAQGLCLEERTGHPIAGG